VNLRAQSFNQHAFLLHDFGKTWLSGHRFIRSLPAKTVEGVEKLSEVDMINSLTTARQQYLKEESLADEEAPLEEVFRGEIPLAVECLLFNLRSLTLQSPKLQFDSIKYIYAQALTDTTLRQRQQLFQYILEHIEAARLEAVALIPLIRFETEHTITTPAVQAYLRNRKVSFAHPLGATEDLFGLLDAGRVSNHGAVISAMVCFGDRRICTALRPLRSSITPLEAKAFALATTSHLHECTIEFCLTWLVDLVKREKFSVAIQIATAVSSMVANDPNLKVQSLHYNFGPFGFSSANMNNIVSLQKALQEYRPIIETLSEARIPSLDLMITLFRDPTGSSHYQPERRREVATRRKYSDRRASNRRIVNLSPQFNRRRFIRREGTRRTMSRR